MHTTTTARNHSPHRRRRRPSRFGVAFLAVLALVASACGGDDDSAGGSGGGGGGGTIKVGLIAPLSGPLGPIGSNFLTGAEALVDAINEDGGIDGRQIEILAEDDANDPAEGIAAARSLVGEDVVAILGPPVSSMVDAIQPTTSRAEVPILTFGASPSSLDPVQETVFQVDQQSSSQAQPMVEFAEALLGSSDFSMALGPVDTPSGLEWGERVEELSGDKGIDVVANVPIPAAGGDISTQAQALAAEQPDAILVEVIDAPLITLTQRLRDLGYEGPIINYLYGSSPTTFEQIADPEVYGARTTVVFDAEATEPGAKRFAEVTEAAGAVDAANNATQYASGYLAMLILEAALGDCGDDCSGGSVTEALSDIEIDTEGFATRPLTFSADDHQAIHHSVFYHWDGEAPVPALDGQEFAGSVYSLGAE